MTPASALRKDANRASLLVSPSRDMLAPPSGQRGTPYAPVAALNTRPCDSVRLERCSETAAAEAPETRAVHRRTAVSRRLFPLFPDAAFRPRPAAVPPGQAPRPGPEDPAVPAFWSLEAGDGQARATAVRRRKRFSARRHAADENGRSHRCMRSSLAEKARHRAAPCSRGVIRRM